MIEIERNRKKFCMKIGNLGKTELLRTKYLLLKQTIQDDQTTWWSHDGSNLIDIRHLSIWASKKTIDSDIWTFFFLPFNRIHFKMYTRFCSFEIFPRNKKKSMNTEWLTVWRGRVVILFLNVHAKIFKFTVKLQSMTVNILHTGFKTPPGIPDRTSSEISLWFSQSRSFGIPR